LKKRRTAEGWEFIPENKDEADRLDWLADVIVATDITGQIEETGIGDE